MTAVPGPTDIIVHTEEEYERVRAILEGRTPLEPEVIERINALIREAQSMKGENS